MLKVWIAKNKKRIMSFSRYESVLFIWSFVYISISCSEKKKTKMKYQNIKHKLYEYIKKYKTWYMHIYVNC